MCGCSNWSFVQNLASCQLPPSRLSSKATPGMEPQVTDLERYAEAASPHAPQK